MSLLKSMRGFTPQVPHKGFNPQHSVIFPTVVKSRQLFWQNKHQSLQLNFTASPPTKQDLRPLSQVRKNWNSLAPLCLCAEEEHSLILNIPANHSFCLGRCLSIQAGEAFVDLVSLIFAKGAWADSSLPVLLSSTFFRCSWQFVEPHALRLFMSGTWLWGRVLPGPSRVICWVWPHLTPPLKIIGTSYFLMEVPGPIRHFMSFWKPATVSFRSLTAGVKKPIPQKLLSH